jgi:hypothetical protein
MSIAANVVHARLSDIRACPENGDVYGGLSLSDPDVDDLLASIRANGSWSPSGSPATITSSPGTAAAPALLT